MAFRQVVRRSYSCFFVALSDLMSSRANADCRPFSKRFPTRNCVLTTKREQSGELNHHPALNKEIQADKRRRIGAGRLTVGVVYESACCRLLEGLNF